MAKLLITGGAGFIGSHTCLALLEANHDLVVLDNYSNSSPEALRRVDSLAGITDHNRFNLIEGDIRSSLDLEKAFKNGKERIDAVIHFAGLKAVGESFTNPLKYWDVNLNGSRLLLEAMKKYECKTIVFSSSATIYGYSNESPIKETALIQPTNPYGQTKAAVENLLFDVFKSQPDWRIGRLRYFNPVGAHPSGLIGEAPNGTPHNLFPFVSQVAVGKLSILKIFGDDWPTPDGTAVRDYIHILDLAQGHMAALDFLLKGKPQLLTVNLGSGKGYSVLDVVTAFEKVNSQKVEFEITKRRQGDVASCIADPGLAFTKLGWQTQRSLEDMCRDTWEWQRRNPMGYHINDC